MKEKGYTPQPGSKVDLAATAMLDGPVPTESLRKVMDCAPKNIHTLLSVALMHGYMVRVKDETGLIHYALGNLPLDDRFTLDCDTGKSEQPDKSKTNWNQGAFPSNPFPVSERAAQVAPPNQGVKAIGIAAAAAVANPKPSNPTVESPPARKFIAGFFSNGELTINIDDHLLTLSRDHIIELRTFLKTIQEAA